MNAKFFLQRVPKGIGVAFCLVWLAAIAAFPLIKRQPEGYIPVLLGVLVGLIFCSSKVRDRINARLERIPSVRFWLGLLGLALIVRLFTLLIWPTWPGSDAGIYHANAIELLETGGYRDSAFQPPGLPFLLAGWYWITIPHPVAGYLMSIFLSVMSVGLIYDVAQRSLSPLAARWAAILAGVIPTYIFTAARTDASALLVFIFLLVADLTLISLQNSWKGWITSGSGHFDWVWFSG